MTKLGRFMSVMAVIFFVGTLVSAWRVAVYDGADIWYVPLVFACTCAAMTVGALQQRKKRHSDKKE